MAARVRQVTCAGPSCKVRFTPKRSTAKYHAAACRVAAQRARDAKKATASKTSAKPAKKTATRTTAPKRTEAAATATKVADNHALVVALRQELESAKALDTFEGQLALELARRLVTPGENASALADKVRAAKAAALGSKLPAAGTAPEAEPEDDEVTKARRRREEIAAAAAAE